MGGDTPATATTETIDMGSSNPAWQLGPNMSQARTEMNAVILPSGKVLALGGSVNDEDRPRKVSMLIFTIPPQIHFLLRERIHSRGCITPWLYFCRCHSLGGRRQSHARHVRATYRDLPAAYLFQSDGSLAARPSITSVPSSVSYGNQFTVQTPDAASIASAVLIRNGTVTHAFGMDQRMVGMSFTAGPDLDGTAPSTATSRRPDITCCLF